MTEANLITSYIFHEKEFLIKMNVINGLLEICITDKQSGEEWQCCYDQAYIENLTHKTGNFKQFDIFATMLKSGLLKTSESITLDLLTYEDLDALRMRRIRSHNSRTLMNKQKNNRRYLILIYNVEFDRILYPLPLEYCGPPNPEVLQCTIRKLESELAKAKAELENQDMQCGSRQMLSMQKCMDELKYENMTLRNEVKHLTKLLNGKSKNNVQALHSAIAGLEKSVAVERKTHHRVVEKLRQEKIGLLQEIEKLKSNERYLRGRYCGDYYRSPSRIKQDTVRLARKDSLKTIFRKQSPINFPKIEIKTHSVSNSPKRSKSEGWMNDKLELQKPRRRKLPRKPPRSTCSSGSSCKCSDRGDVPFNNNLGIIRSTSKEKASRRQSSLDRISVGSTASTVSSSRKHRSSEILKMKMKCSEGDFQALENRITTLQKMLQENIHIE